MRVLLVQPPVQDFYDTDVRLQPIGLCYLKAAANKFLPEVEVVLRDYHQGHGRHTVRHPKELEYLKEFYTYADKSPFSTFHNYYHFGLDFDAIEADIARINPDVVGISSLFTPYYREVLEIAARVKRRLNKPVVLGGSHVSALPEFMLLQDSVDYIIRGEGEKPFVEFLRFLRGEINIHQVPNLGFKENGRTILNPMADNFELDELPFPHLGDTDPNTYDFWGKPMTFMITSRSCPHKCSFCSVHLTFGTRYRRRSIENVLSEIQLRFEQGYRVIDFEDDNLTFYKKEMKELCRRLIEMFPQKEMQFVAMNGISYLSLDDEMLELMWQAGFTHLNLALVSSDKSVRETTKRPHTIEAYLKVIDKATSLGMKIVSYQILGLPNETLKSMIQTLTFNARLPVLLGASMFYRTPESPIAKGLTLNEMDYFKARLTAMAVETQDFNREDIYTLFITTRIINFLKGVPLKGHLYLMDLLDLKWPDPRTSIGFDLLRDLLIHHRPLSYWTTSGKKENFKFNRELFFTVLKQCEFIEGLEGTRITTGLHTNFLKNLL